MTTLQEQARALGDPTRHDIFRHVAVDGDAAVGLVVDAMERRGFEPSVRRTSS